MQRRTATLLGVLALSASAYAWSDQQKDAEIKTKEGNIMIKVGKDKSVYFAEGDGNPVSLNDIDSVVASLETTVLGRNSRQAGNDNTGTTGAGGSLMDKVDTLTSTTSTGSGNVVDAIKNASVKSTEDATATTDAITSLANNLVGEESGVLTQLLELNKNLDELKKIPDLIALQTAANEVSSQQLEKTGVAGSSVTFATCLVDGKQVGCTVAGSRLAIAGHEFVPNFPGLYTCVLKTDRLRKDLTSLPSAATNDKMIICDLPAFDVGLPEKELELDLTVYEGGKVINSSPVKVNFKTQAPVIAFAQEEFKIGASTKTFTIPFQASDGDTNVNTLKYSFKSKDCGNGMFDDKNSFKVSGSLGSINRNLEVTPKDTKATAQDAKCTITVTVADDHWESSASIVLVRLGILASCSDWYHSGARDSGIYQINFYGLLGNGQEKVYCKFGKDSSAWTLISSFAKRHSPGQADKSFLKSVEFARNEPNFDLYRMSKKKMETLRDRGSRWMAATNNKIPQNDGYNIDHAVVSHLSLDILEMNQGGICTFVESTAVRYGVGNGGAKCTQCYMRWWGYNADSIHLHHDSGNHQSQCYREYLGVSYDGVSSEDNFGHYGSPSTKFSGCKSASSTTQYWYQDLPPRVLGGSAETAAKSCTEIMKKAKEEGRIPFNGRYYVTQNGKFSARVVYCKMENTANAPNPLGGASAWTLWMSYTLRRRDTAASHLKDISWSPGNPHGSKYRESKSFINHMRQQGAAQWYVTCNGDMNELKGDHARAKWSTFNILTFSGGGKCVMHEAFAVRNNRRSGARCKNCWGKWWQDTNGALHNDSGNHHSSCGGPRYWAGAYTVGSEDNFGGYWSRSAYHPCSNNDWATTNWWSSF